MLLKHFLPANNLLMYGSFSDEEGLFAYSLIFRFVGFSKNLTSCASGSQPPLSVVGLTEEQAVKQAKGDILVFASSFNPMKNTISG